jgi:hypothetical protein
MWKKVNGYWEWQTWIRALSEPTTLRRTVEEYEPLNGLVSISRELRRGNDFGRTKGWV